MCGIYGTTRAFNAELISKKMALISHRGPDFQDFQYVDNVGMGHVRLSIIDLDKRSNQPLFYEKVTIVFNGEIYNYRLLRQELRDAGFSFQTESDTEVICAAYLKWGAACVERLRGMFAFVIYDRANNRLFGARDRMGQKPFFYRLYNGSFEFSSELYPILVGNGSFELDERSASDVLTRKYIVGDKSIVKGVRKLLPAHWFTYDLSDNSFETRRYWHFEPFQPYNQSFEDAKTDLKSLLRESVSERLISDVPLGVFLSGGIDSSLIAAIASECSSETIKTFSVRFAEPDFDESKYASEVAGILGTNHTTIDCSLEEGLDIVANFSDYYDEPFADASAIPSLILSKHTRKHVKVALSGDAGDENFLGYNRYLEVKSLQRLYNLPGGLRKLGATALTPFRGYRFDGIKKALALPDLYSFYSEKTSLLNKDKLLLNTELTEIPVLDNLAEHFEGHPLLKLSSLDLTTYIPDDINVKVDRASMRYALEVRSPLLDHRIIEFSRGLPEAYVLRGKQTKYILRKLLDDYFPPALFERTKSGFSFPIAKWFRGPLKEEVSDLFNSEVFNMVPNLNTAFARKMLEEHLSGKANRSAIIWNVYTVVKWMDSNRLVL